MVYIGKRVHKKLLFIFALMLGVGFSFSQYFYYTGVVDNGYQQGCNEILQARFDTEGVGVNAGRMQILLDKTKLTYETSTNAATLQANLLNGISSPWPDWANPNGTPSWVDTSGPIYDIIDAQRYKNGDTSAVNGDNGFLNIKFVPKFGSNDYSVDFGMEYNGSTNKTALTMGGVQKINATSQNNNKTGTINIVRQPCIDDNEDPSIQNNVPGHNNTYWVVNNGLDIYLSDDEDGSSSVPYAYTGANTWSNNTWGADNQYGIDSGSISVVIEGTGADSSYHNVTLNQVGDFNWVPSDKTWQNLNKNYTITVTSGDLFDFGVENEITLTVGISDRVLAPNTNSSTYNRTFNSPRPPVIENQNPGNTANFVQLTQNVIFDITDDWAGVDTGTVEVVLSGMNAESSGYLESYSAGDVEVTFQLLPNRGTALGQSGGYTVTVNAADFNPNSIIKVTASGADLKGNTVTDSWTFTTRPECEELGCCDGVELQTGVVFGPFPYTGSVLYVSGGLNPEFTWPGFGNTGYIDCDNTDGALSLYSGDESTNEFLSYEELTSLYFSGQNVKAILTGANGNTIILYRFGDFIVKVYPSNRYDPAYKGNEGKLFFYAKGDNTTVLYSGFLTTNTSGSGNYVEDVPAGDYDIVYKGQSHLASYLSGVTILEGTGNVLDYTTGSNLYLTISAEDIEDSGIYYEYQGAGDIKNGEGNHDGEVNVGDITALISSVEYGNSADQYNEYNLNGDTIINNIDLSVIIDNWLLTGAYYDSDPLFDGFVW